MILAEEEAELEDFKRYIRSLLKGYYIIFAVLVCLGIVSIAGSLIWMFFTQSDISTITDLVPIVTVLGLGLIASSATAYPLSEVLKRKDKIFYCEMLLKNIQKVRTEKSNRKTNVDRIDRIKEKCNKVIETLRGC